MGQTCAAELKTAKVIQFGDEPLAFEVAHNSRVYVVVRVVSNDAQRLASGCGLCCFLCISQFAFDSQ